MAVPANSTRTPVAHRRTDITPNDWPDQYVIQSDGLHSIPASLGEGRHVFSTVETPKEGDIVVVRRKPETLAAHEHQMTVYRLAFDISEGVKLGAPTRARTPDDFFVFFIPVGTTDPSERLIFRASEIEAIHKWVGPLKEGGTQPQLALPEPAAPVTEQTELSLLTPTVDGPLTMSSREIAELTGKNHADVMRDIRNMLEGLGNGDESKFAGIYLDAYKREKPCYNLPKEEALILVSGYNVQLRAKIVRRWMELEGAQPKRETTPQFPIPQTFAEALMLAANQAAQIEHSKVQIAEKNAQIADMREDVEALDRIAGADGLFGLREAVAMLQTSQNKFVAWLQRNGWAYRQTGGKRLLAYADKRKAGYATNKATVYEKPDGTEGVNETLKFTPAGIVKLAKKLNVTLTDGDLRALHGGKGRAA